MEWAIPIVGENELVGILTCGQVLIQGKDDLFYESVLKQTGDFGLAERDVNLAIEGVPVVSGRKVRAAAELLRLVAERLSEQVIIHLEEARSRQHQQAEIAEALVLRRECGDDFQESRRLQREIIGLVRIGDLPGARKILNDLLSSILLRSATDLDRLKAEVLELVIMLSRAAVEAGAEIQQILGENLYLLGDLLARQSQEDISHWILKILENFTHSIFKTRNMERVKMISEGLDSFANTSARSSPWTTSAKQSGEAAATSRRSFARKWVYRSRIPDPERPGSFRRFFATPNSDLTRSPRWPGIATRAISAKSSSSLMV
jgi:two-component system response regulator YesN